MNILKKSIVSVVVSAFLSAASLCYAEPAIPDMVGTWSVKSEGGVLLKGKASGTKTHHSGEFSTLTAEAVVTKQQGRVIHGIFKSPKASEKFIAVIGMDNKSFSFADEDGFVDGTFINNDKLEIIYRHVTDFDVVIAAGTWTRVK